MENFRSAREHCSLFASYYRKLCELPWVVYVVSLAYLRVRIGRRLLCRLYTLINLDVLDSCQMAIAAPLPIVSSVVCHFRNESPFRAQRRGNRVTKDIYVVSVWLSIRSKFKLRRATFTAEKGTVLSSPVDVQRNSPDLFAYGLGQFVLLPRSVRSLVELLKNINCLQLVQ